MKLFAITAFATSLAFSAPAYASDVLKDTTVSVTALSGPFDFNLEGNRDGLTELEVGFTTLKHSYSNVDAEARLSFGTDLRGTDTVFIRGEYNFGSEIVDDFAVYGSAAVQYDTNTKFENGVWTFDPMVGASYGVTDRIGVFAEVGYTWELNQAKRDLGGYVEVGVPFAVTEQLYLIPSVSRTFRTNNNETATHLNMTYQF
jgi:hypothetical protein